MNSDDISVVDDNKEDTSPSTSEGTSANTSGTATPQKCSGYWGEKQSDCPDAVNVSNGVAEFENLRLELTRTRTTRHPEAPELNKEADLIEFLTHAQQQDEQYGRHGKKLGVAYKGLSVKGLDSQTSYVKTFLDAVVGSCGPDLYRFVRKWILRRPPSGPLRTLLHDFTGVVRGGEVRSLPYPSFLLESCC